MTGIGNRYEISSLTNDKVKLINSLHHRKYRREHKLFVAEGIRICREAAENGWEVRYLLYDSLNIDTHLIENPETLLGSTSVLDYQLHAELSFLPSKDQLEDK